MYLLKIFLIICVYTCSANAQVASFSFENDAIFKTDKYYTNSVSFGWLSDNDTYDKEKYNNSFYDIINAIDFQKQRTNQSVQITFEHFLFTPEDTDASEKISNDIPYAGVALLGMSVYRWEEDYFHQFGLRLSLIGPSAFGEEAQNGIHNIIGVDDASGWDNQLEDSLGIGINYAFADKTYQRHFNHNQKIEITNQVSFNLGTAFRDFIIGTNFRYGYNMPNNFSTIGKTIGTNQHYSLNLDSKRNDNFGMSINYALFYNHIDYFYITDHDKSYHIDPDHHLVGQIVGLNFYYNNYTLNLSLKEEEFLSKDTYSQRWGTFSIRKVF